VAALLAPRGTVRDAGPHLEQDDEHVRGWFFVVASEGITVGDRTITLPGIGAYWAQATAEKNLAAVGWVVLVMTLVIILYDQLTFRPLVAWADKFRFEQTSAQTAPGSWFLDLLQRGRLFQTVTIPASLMLQTLSRSRFVPLREGAARVRPSGSMAIDVVWFIAVVAAAVFAAWKIIDYVAAGVSWTDVLNVIKLGLFTLTRVVVLIAVASVIWVRIGAITASGGAWNASIVAEAVSWGNTKIFAHGL
jgi:NitT/TauT family transport system permease protein